MTDFTIIGGGFSASVARLMISEECRIITPKKLSYLEMPRRKSIEINKFFSNHAKSLGLLKFNLTQTKLHDRLIFGGNSSIWGGFINMSYLSNKLLDKFGDYGFKVKKLSFEDTGSISNLVGLGQIQDISGGIYNAASLLKGASDGYLESFFIDGHRIGLNLNLYGKKATIYTDKLILCVGTIQLLDLLYRSNFLENGDNIQLSEFGYELKPKFTFTSRLFLDKAVVIRFSLERALCHFLGIQRRLRFFNFFKWVPCYIEQRFLSRRFGCLLRLNDGIISDVFVGKQSLKFGGSIHYCNMKINGEGMNDFFARINPNIIGLGMPFVDQAEPGPIANNILNDAILKLRPYKKKY